NMVVTDFKDRGIPWTRLLLSEGRSAGSAVLNLSAREKVCTALVAGIALALSAAVFFRSVPALAIALAAVLLIVSLNRRFYAVLVRARGIAFAAAAVPLHLIFYFTGGLGAVAGTLLHYTARPRVHLERADDERRGSASPPPADRPQHSSLAVAGTRRTK
ncbi:MAG: hypothetical protein ACRELT_02715, partial [Longimicrobiales bacterium]